MPERVRAALDAAGAEIIAGADPTVLPKARKNPVEREGARTRQRAEDQPELLLGRNPVVEALRARIPATALYVVTGDVGSGRAGAKSATDERITEALHLANDRGLPLLEVGRAEFDRMSGGALHQGIGLQVPPYQYAHPDDLLDLARDSGRPPLVVAMDGVTDPRNLGAVVRSAAAFGAHGVVVPERRSAEMTAGAWKTSAGAAARIPVAKATNLARALRAYQEAGLFVIGLDGAGDTDIADARALDQPMCLVVGSEGAGMSRIVTETCDLVVRIPIVSSVESLNAGVAAGVALYEITRARSAGGPR